MLINYDACVVLTDHSNIDYNLIYDNSDLIIDTRNIFKDYDSDYKIKRLGDGKIL